MDWITVTGVKPYDGRYELQLDESPLTTREWGWIKRHAGYLPADLDEKTFTDPEMITMLALIAMRRADKITAAQVGEVWDRFVDAPFGSAITLEPDPDVAGEDDAGPPAESSNGSSSISGDSSTTGSASSDEPPSPTGSPASVTSESLLETLAS